jgi:hypothetical protein
VSFAAINLCVASQRVFISVSVYFIMDSVRKLLDTPSCVTWREFLFRISTTIRHQTVFVINFVYITICVSYQKTIFVRFGLSM